MKVDVLTLFPEMFAGPLDVSIVQRARNAGLLELVIHNLRDWTHDRHKTVDDKPFGGGPGMVLKPEPLFEAAERLLAGNHAENAQWRAEQSKARTAQRRPDLLQNQKKEQNL